MKPFFACQTHLVLALSGLTLGLSAPSTEAAGPLLKEQGLPRLIESNRFQAPEDVLRHYCARDAWGFVWSGMLRGEVSALTEWKHAPQAEGFHVIQGYSIGQTHQLSQSEVEIPVSYQIVGIGQGSGAFVPHASGTATVEVVRFRLKKTQGRWKITSPQAIQIEPRVMVEYSPAKPSVPGKLPERLRDLR